MSKRPYKSYIKTPEENRVNKIVGLNIRNLRIKYKWTGSKNYKVDISSSRNSP